MRALMLGVAVGCCAIGAAALAGPKKAATVAKPAARPGSPAPAVGITKANLLLMLKGLGLTAVAVGPYQQLSVEEEKYGYKVDVGLSQSGEWLVCMAHLATVPDLTAVRSAPLISLLAANDGLLGMAFSYDRTNGRIMLNATTPARTLDKAGLKRVLERLRAAVLQNQERWDTANW